MKTPPPLTDFGSRFDRLFARPLPVLIGCLLLTLLATLFAWRAVEARRDAAAESEVDTQMARLDARLAAYVALLRATRSFVLAEGSSLSGPRFAVFVGGLRVDENYPGIQGIGWSPRVGAGPDEFRILFLEPMDERNRAALGFNMHSEAARADAMDRARDSGAVSLTGSVVLKQEIETEKSAGFLLYAPVYRAGVVPATVAQRRESLLGFVYAPFRAPDFFRSVFQAGSPVRVAAIHAAAGSGPALLYAAEGGPAKKPVLRTMALGGQTWTLHFDADGVAHQLEEIAAPVVVFAMGAAISVLLFQLAAIQARRRQRAEERAAAMGRQAQFAQMLVGIVSHDLRNPMNVIQLNATLLERASLSDEFARCVQRIQSSCANGVRLIRDLLDFTQARVGSGIPVVRTPGDLLEIAQQAVDELHLAHPRRQVVMRSQGDGAGTWDGDRMRQVIGNLVNNALVYGAADAPVTVSVEGRGTRVMLKVHNQGPPIPADLQASLFEPLQQGHSRAGSPGRNIGLGLYIVRAIVQAHGGSVACVSNAESGTTFIADMPRA